MSIKKRSSRSNMYNFVDSRWNPVRGKCGFCCKYCYTRRWGKQRPIHLDEKELRVDLGSGNFIFVCSGCDLFDPAVPDEWIDRVSYHARQFQDNQYLFHTKNPARILDLTHRGYSWPDESVVCVTVESNIPWPGISEAPQPYDRIESLKRIGFKKMITIEPVMDFDVMTFAEMIISCKPIQVNIGADSSGNHLPEPTPEKLEQLIDYLTVIRADVFSPAKIHLKKNLRRLLPEHRLYGGENG